MQEPRRFDPGGIEAGLAVAGVGVALFGLVAAALGLEVIGGDHEHRALAGPEGLHQRGAAAVGERALGQGDRRAHRADAVGAVDQADPDRVVAGAFARVHETPVPVRAGGVERGDELGDRGLGPITVVLQLHQRGQVRIQGLHHRHQLGLLAPVFGQGRGAAPGRETAAVAIAIEQVEHVEAGDAAVAGHLGRGWARGLLDNLQRRHQLQPMAAETLVEHAFDRTQAAADPQRRGVAGQRRQEPEALRVATRAAIVEHQPAARVFGRGRGVAGRRRGEFGRMDQGAAEAGQQLAVGHQGVIPGDAEAADPQAHAFVALPIGGRFRRAGQLEHRHRGAWLALAQHLHLAGLERGQRRLAFAEFAHGAADPDAVADGQPRFGAGLARQEQPFGRGRVAVVLLGLEENAAQAVELAHDDRLDGHRLAFERTARAAALDPGEGRQAVVGGRGGAGVVGGSAATGQQAGGGHQGKAHFRTPETATPPGGGVGGWARAQAYLRLSTIHWTVAATCSSVSEGLPPLAGMMPAEPW